MMVRLNTDPVFAGMGNPWDQRTSNQVTTRIIGNKEDLELARQKLREMGLAFLLPGENNTPQGIIRTGGDDRMFRMASVDIKFVDIEDFEPHGRDYRGPIYGVGNDDIMLGGLDGGKTIPDSLTGGAVRIAGSTREETQYKFGRFVEKYFPSNTWQEALHRDFAPGGDGFEAWHTPAGAGSEATSRAGFTREEYGPGGAGYGAKKAGELPNKDSFPPPSRDNSHAGETGESGVAKGEGYPPGTGGTGLEGPGEQVQGSQPGVVQGYPGLEVGQAFQERAGLAANLPVRPGDPAGGNNDPGDFSGLRGEISQPGAFPVAAPGTGSPGTLGGGPGNMPEIPQGGSRFSVAPGGKDDRGPGGGPVAGEKPEGYPAGGSTPGGIGPGEENLGSREGSDAGESMLQFRYGEAREAYQVALQDLNLRKAKA